MKDMKLIMENWRKFSDELNISEKTILIERKDKVYTLESLISEHKSRKISTDQFNNILIESIEKDFQELQELDLKQAAQNVAGAVKTGYEKVKSGVKGAYDAINDKLLELFVRTTLKLSSMVKTAATKVAPYVIKFINFISPKNMKPETKKLLLKILGILAFAAIMWIIFGPKNAQAAVKITTKHGNTLVADEYSKDVLDAITQYVNGPAGYFDPNKEKLIKLADHIRNKGEMIDLNKEPWKEMKDAFGIFVDHALEQKGYAKNLSGVERVLTTVADVGKEAMQNAVQVSNQSGLMGIKVSPQRLQTLLQSAEGVMKLGKDLGIEPSAENATQFAQAIVKKFGVGQPLSIAEKIKTALGK